MFNGNHNGNHYDDYKLTAHVNWLLGRPSGLQANPTSFDDEINVLVDTYNAAGGLLGKQIILDRKDSGGDPTITIQRATECLSDGCVAIIGPVIDPECLPMIQWAEDNKIVHVNLGAIGSGVSKGIGKYTYQGGPSTYAVNQAVSKYLISNGTYHKVYTIGVDASFGYDAYTVFWTNIKSAGLSWQDVGLDHGWVTIILITPILFPLLKRRVRICC